MTEPMTYKTTEVCQLTGATYRQLDYWCRRGWIEGMEGWVGSGQRRHWTDGQVERVRALKAASDIRNQTIAEAAS